MGVIRVVLTDLDGVIRRWPASQFQSVEDAYGLERGSLSRAAFDKPLLTDAITGAITDAQWRKQIARLLGSQTDPATAASAVAAWSTSPGEVDTVDFIINSSAIGCAKPSTCFYEHAARRCGCAREEVFFVDDRSENVDAAINFGFHGHLYRDANTLEQALRECGLIRGESHLRG